MIDGGSRKHHNSSTRLIKEVEVEKIVYVDRPFEVIRTVDSEPRIIEHFIPVETIQYVEGPTAYKLETVSVPSPVEYVDIHHFVDKVVDRVVEVPKEVHVLPRRFKLYSFVACVLSFFAGYSLHTDVHAQSGIGGGIARTLLFTPIYTTSTLPTCNTAATGRSYAVSDATTPTYLGLYTGGSTSFSPVVCTGTQWETY